MIYGLKMYILIDFVKIQYAITYIAEYQHAFYGFLFLQVVIFNSHE